MAAYTKIESFMDAVAKGKIDLSTDEFMIALVAAANTPDPTVDTKLADLTEIAYTFAGSRVLTTSYAFVSGAVTLSSASLNLAATGGDVGPFQYVVVYDNTATDKDLVAMFDLGGESTILDGNSGTFSFTDDDIFAMS